MKKVFIDGKAGTTGLRIYERLAGRNDIELLLLSDEDRKNTEKRREALNSCDIAFLCLPDDAACESVALTQNPDTVIIDTSTAHRTSEGWAYGFPELSPAHYEHISKSKRIAVPGCHASGFIACVYPLVESGYIDADTELACVSITGYSGGGRKMIEEYRDPANAERFLAPRQYALSQQHKHLKEMKAQCNLTVNPMFGPFVCDFYSGMQASVPIFAGRLRCGHTADDVKELFRGKYNTRIVSYCDDMDENGFLSATLLSGKDSMKVSVFGNEERILLCAAFDNLGKGSSGAAIECMNISLGLDAEYGLEL